jgi:hypothetical protein
MTLPESSFKIDIDASLSLTLHEAATTCGDALSRKGRGRSNAHREDAAIQFLNTCSRQTVRAIARNNR